MTMNKSKKILNILAASAITALAVSCGGQDEIYQEWVKKGGYDYPAKPINLTSVSGYQSVVVNWEKPMDPAVRTAKLFWDNYANSLDIDYADYPDGKISMEVDNLEDRSYTFDIVNYDDAGNQSLAAEITVSPYGDGWMVSRSERTITSARMDGRDAKIVMSKATDEMVATRFRYKNLNDEWVECETILKPGENEVTFPDALKGKRFEYSSSFCPAAGKDTVWRAWTKSTDGISYQIDGSRWPNVTATSGQTLSGTDPNNIIDGVISVGKRWHSSRTDGYKDVFPKILSIDTGLSGEDALSFTAFEFCQNPESQTLRYIRNYVIYVGDTPFNPDEKDYVNNFGIPLISGSLTIDQANQIASVKSGATGRYISIVFLNSWNATNGYIDLWELIPYGYIPSQAD